MHGKKLDAAAHGQAGAVIVFLPAGRPDHRDVPPGDEAPPHSPAVTLPSDDPSLNIAPLVGV